MLIKSIKYDNFRPFFGHQELDLSSDDDKNIVVILAQNTCGKTTIVLSFVWCFYGISKFKNPEDILNHSLAKDMAVGAKKDAKVEVVFSHEDIEYTVRRTHTYSKMPNGMLRLDTKQFDVLYVDENGETRTVGHTEKEKIEAINSIMPEDLSSYFFFEGEKSNAVTKKDIGNAVKELLGLDIYSNMMKHLHGDTQKVSTDSVMGYYLSRANDGSNAKATNIFHTIQKYEEELEKKHSELEEQEGNKSFYQEKIEDINQKLRDAAPTKALQEKRDLIIGRIQREKANLSKQYDAFFRSFSLESFDLFLSPLFAKAKERIDAMDLGDKGIKGIDLNAITELLNRGVCLCGTHLNEGSVAYENVAAYIDVVPPREVGVYVRDMLDSFPERISKGEEYVQKFASQYADIQLSIQNISELESEEEECFDELKKVEGVDTDKLESDIRLYKGRISGAERQIIALNSRIDWLDNEIKKLEKEYNEYKSKNETTKRFETLYSYAEAIYEWVKKTYVQRENDLKIELQERFENLFNDIYSGKRKAVIDEKYNLHVYNSDGKELALTGALETITYFSFVGALVQLASEAVEKRAGKEEAEQFGEFYPLVLDAAFSHTDDYHTKSVANCLANSTKQLVFAVMDKDWQYAKDGIESKVVRKYTIDKIAEDQSKITPIA